MPIKRLTLSLVAAVISAVTLLTSPLILAGSATDPTLLPIDLTAQNPLPPPQTLTFLDMDAQNTAQIATSIDLTATNPLQLHTTAHPTADTAAVQVLTFLYSTGPPAAPPHFTTPRGIPL